MDAELLGVLLPTLETAPACWQTGAFALRDPPPPPEDDDDEYADVFEPLNALAPAPPRELADVMDATVLARAAARGAAARLASVLACVDRACRAAANKFAPAEQRVARVAQVQATHDMAHALLKMVYDGRVRSEAAALLAAWCCVADAASALDGRYDDQASPADKWRAFARDIAQTAEVPLRIMRARTTNLTRTMVGLLGMVGHPVPLLPQKEAELQQLVAQDTTPWLEQLIKLLQGAPA